MRGRRLVGFRQLGLQLGENSAQLVMHGLAGHQLGTSKFGFAAGESFPPMGWSIDVALVH